MQFSVLHIILIHSINVLSYREKKKKCSFSKFFHRNEIDNNEIFCGDINEKKFSENILKLEFPLKTASNYRCGYCRQTSNWKHVIEVCALHVPFFFQFHKMSISYHFRNVYDFIFFLFSGIVDWCTTKRMRSLKNMISLAIHS